MKLIDKIKKSNNTKWILLIVAVILIINNSGEIKKEAEVFDTTSDCNPGAGSICLIGCDIADIGGCLSKNHHEQHECRVEWHYGDPDYCVNCVRSGYYADSRDYCCSGYISEGATAVDGNPSHTVYLCRDQIDSDVSEECNARERTIGNLLAPVLPSLGCKTRYYITLFGGAFMALMLFAAL